ncbi:YfiR family protein [Marichromatium sp. AB32]|nr:YfiR family protein [Marichromatium sp. AB32]RNE91753.1 YfiR family protein [Marichromatium sp. AB32]
MRRRCGTLMVSMLLYGSAVCAGVEEGELMAAYLYNFSKFIHWPPRAESLHLCVYGRSESAQALEALNGKQVQGRSMTVVRRSRGESLESCHIVYVADSERPFLAAVLRSLAGRPVLTVSEIPEFVAAGGMVRFVRVERRLRFEINAASARAAGLGISSQLLKLAVDVVRD